MSKPQFTFKNYLKEVKKSWLLVAIFVALGAVGGAVCSFARPTIYAASAKISVYNSAVNTGSITSPYAQISELLMSGELVKGDLEEYTVVEKPFGVFEIIATSTNSDKAIETADAVVDNVDEAINKAFDDAGDYRITILGRASKTTPTITMRNRIISTTVSIVSAFVLALVIIFVKFDYIAEK